MLTALALCVVVMPRVGVRILGSDGLPVAGAYIVYHVQGHRLNFVDSLTFDRGGAIVRSDAAGVFVIPREVLWRRPYPLDYGLEPAIDLLFAPRLHHAARHPLRRDERPGVLERSGGDLILYPRDTRPEDWMQSIGELRYVVMHEVKLGMGLAGGSYVALRAAPGVREELMKDLQGEYAGFLERFGETLRVIPDPPAYVRSDPEREAFARNYAKSIERFPTWGDYARSVWADDLGIE